MQLNLVADESSMRVEGSFDGLAARRIQVELARATPGSRFHIDLTLVREFHDFAIAVLAQALSGCRAQVTVRGLGLHRIRVLRSFDIDTVPLERAALLEGA